ncbi:hypothetical protein J6590_040698 [Homalodisca vitripennis]|nr:hypothetical protein J6590_040698 [Homalodisca vitripennis]
MKTENCAGGNGETDFVLKILKNLLWTYWIASLRDVQIVTTYKHHTGIRASLTRSCHSVELPYVKVAASVSDAA